MRQLQANDLPSPCGRRSKVARLLAIGHAGSFERLPDHNTWRWSSAARRLPGASYLPQESRFGFGRLSESTPRPRPRGSRLSLRAARETVNQRIARHLRGAEY
jgi:hypothetical protein